MTFAGDVPRGHLVQLMKADFERLIGGAQLGGEGGEARRARSGRATMRWRSRSAAWAARIVLGDRTEEEVEAVLDVLPKGTQVTGFYSYGEISPVRDAATATCTTRP